MPNYYPHLARLYGLVPFAVEESMAQGGDERHACLLLRKDVPPQVLARAVEQDERRTGRKEPHDKREQRLIEKVVRVIWPALASASKRKRPEVPSHYRHFA